MISYEEARHRILESICSLGGSEKLRGIDALGRILQVDIVAVEPNPRFTNSALDGYCVTCEADASAGAAMRVVGETAAGEPAPDVGVGEALRVFTGARLPENAHAVAYQEETNREEDTVTLLVHAPKGQGVREAGSDFGVGETILHSGDVIGSGGLALLASQGASMVDVFAIPSVSVIVTGNEISATPNAEQIYDSNSPMLAAQVESAGCKCALGSVGDELDTLRSALQRAAENHDAIIVSGGASVGDYDFLARAAEEIGEIVFHRVSIKPGKPFLFAKIAGKPLFGLPGNPASAFVAFLLFVKPALMTMGGRSRLPSAVLLQLKGDFETENREEWLRCRFVEDGVVEPVAAQASYGLRSLSPAEVLVRVPVNTRHASGELRSGLLV